MESKMVFLVRLVIALLAFWGTGVLGASSFLVSLAQKTPPKVMHASAQSDVGTQDTTIWQDYLEGKRRIRIGLVTGANEVQLTCDSPFKVTQGETTRECQPTDIFTSSDATHQPVRLVSDRSAIWTVRVNGKPFLGNYTGPMEVFTSPNATDDKPRLTLVNEPPFEQYIEGVVSKEVGSTFSLEAQRAQAIAARSYTLNYLGRRQSEGFDLYADQNDQVFQGIPDRLSRIHTAVFSTRGQVLIYNDQPIKALYCSTCGGETAAIEATGLDTKACPYLSGCSDEPKPRPRLSGEDKIAAVLAEHSTSFCKIAPASIYRWQKVLTAAEVDAFIGKNLVKLSGQTGTIPGKVKSMRVSVRSGGRAQALEVVCENGIFEVKGNDIRWLFGKGKPDGLKSTFFVLSATNDAQGNPQSFTFTGGGWGHGVGMCQYGAEGRARAGQSAQEILAAYYPGTRLWTARLGDDE
jgi:SpoIID/LytB domain protein